MTMFNQLSYFGFAGQANATGFAELDAPGGGPFAELILMS
jgi:hypothetical protein